MKQCPFLLRLCQEVLLRVFRWFFFFAVPFAGSGKWMQSVSACPMNETGSHTQRAIREEWLLSPGWTSPVGSENNHTSFVVVCPFHASGDVFFLLVIPFLRIFPWSFFYPISLCFRLPPFLRLSVSRIRQSFSFRVLEKVGIRECKVFRSKYYPQGWRFFPETGGLTLHSRQIPELPLRPERKWLPDAAHWKAQKWR